jgi:CubicO group peptidase (beta-lactamase class C family)
LATLEGHCDPRFSRVYETLERHVRAGDEVGASLYVSIDGEEVVDLWGGWRDREHSGSWTRDTVVNVFSASKTVASLAVLMLADRGEIDLFAPVADYWPEFARNGKAKAQVRHLISHTVGLPAWEQPFSQAEAMDVVASTRRLAEQTPWWEPGERGSYHASTFGHLVSELVLRVTGRTLSAFIAEEITGPLQAEFYLGLSDDQFDRVATVYPVESSNEPSKVPPPPADAGVDLSTELAIAQRTRQGSFSGQKRDATALFNSPDWRRSAIAGSSGHANARGLGRAMTVLANDGVSRGVSLLSPATIALIFQEQFRGFDSYYMKPIRWGIGYALAPEVEMERGPLPFLRPGPRTCYWYGTGGSVSLADADRRIAIGYAMNQCQSGSRSLNGVYYDAIYDSL